jgi:hypothetical protein
LSITHHTRKRPSTDPRTTHGPQEPKAPFGGLDLLLPLLLSISSTSTTTKQKLEKTTIAYYFGVLHHSMFVPSITMTLLYIGMGVDGNFPQAPSGYFLPSPWWTRNLQETPQDQRPTNPYMGWATPPTYYSPESSGIQSLAAVYAKSVAQNPYEPL